jgi:hypothetical protein
MNEERVNKSKKELVYLTIKELARTYGDCAFDVKTISRHSKVPAKELYDYDHSSGILVELNNDGKIILSDYSEHPLVELDSFW